MPGRIGCVHNKLISKHSADNLIREQIPDFRRNKVKIYSRNRESIGIRRV